MTTIELISAATDAMARRDAWRIDLLAAGSRLRGADAAALRDLLAACVEPLDQAAAAKRRAECEADILEGLCHAVETWIAASGGGSGRQYDALRVLLNSIPGVCYCHACCSARGEA